MNQLQETPETLIIHNVTQMECVSKSYNVAIDMFDVVLSGTPTDINDVDLLGDPMGDRVHLSVPPGEFADLFEKGKTFDIDMAITVVV